MRRTSLLLAMAGLAAACTSPPSPPPPEQPRAPATQAPPPEAAPPRATLPKLPPPKTPLDAYKREMAQRILEKNAARTFEGQPPHFLKAVVVLQFNVDAQGRVSQVKTLRTRNAVLAKVAADTLRAANPLPTPPAGLLRRGSLELAETWLFRDDDRFQVRSLALEQPKAD